MHQHQLPYGSRREVATTFHLATLDGVVPSLGSTETDGWSQKSYGQVDIMAAPYRVVVWTYFLRYGILRAYQGRGVFL